MTRVSILEDDPGFPQYRDARADGKTVHAFLDGQEVRWVTTADEEQGFLLADVLDADGLPQVDPRNPDQWWQEKRTGVVRIEFRSR